MKRLLLILPLFWLTTVRGQESDLPYPAYPPLEQFEEINQRPLFNESRRPEVNKDDAHSSKSSTSIRKKWRLTGVVWEGDQQLALFGERQGEEHMRLKAGMYLSGNWQLEAINIDSVHLGDGIQTLRLDLWEPRQPPTRIVFGKTEHPDNNSGHSHDENAEPDTGSAGTTTPDNNNKQGSNGE